jgi:phosphomannomutase
MVTLLRKLKETAVVGFVGGSDLDKQREQLGDIVDLFDFSFSENGVIASRKGTVLPSPRFIDKIGETKYNILVDFMQKYIADLDIQNKKSKFVECRNGMINVSPIGRDCSQSERNAFESYDKTHSVREGMISVLKKTFVDYKLTFSIGGQISFDVFPAGWDKTYCLRHLENEGFKCIYFYGDKTQPGENDYELYIHPAVNGVSVTSPENTIELVTRTLQSLPSST